MEQITIKSLFNRDDVKNKFQELLGKRAPSFITSVLQIVSQNALLSKADPASIYHSAAVAATLDLPLNNNLGFAYIVPYNAKQKDGSFKQVAQFQMGYKGFIQLAQRSGQFLTISSTHITDKDKIKGDRLLGTVFEFSNEPGVIIGYASYFKLLNGFEKVIYMTVEDLKKHGVKYSKTFSNKNGLWNTDFDVMANKTVIKLLLSRFAPLSIEMQKAVIVDQSVINNVEGTEVTYLDNENVEIDKEAERVVLMLNDANTIKELMDIKEILKPDQMPLYEEKLQNLMDLENRVEEV